MTANRRNILKGAGAVVASLPGAASVALALPSAPTLEDSRVATVDEAAVLDFEAWKEDEDSWIPPTNMEWSQQTIRHLVNIRIAWVLLHKTKPELMQVVSALSEEALSETMDELQETADFFKGLHEIVDGAQVRMLVAGAALAIQQGAGEAA